MTVNRKDRELDIVLISAKDGRVVRNLTNGFDKDHGDDHIVQYGERFEMPWMAWSPKGDRLAFFVRTEKERTLIIQNVLTAKIEERIPMKSSTNPNRRAFRQTAAPSPSPRCVKASQISSPSIWGPSR